MPYTPLVGIIDQNSDEKNFSLAVKNKGKVATITQKSDIGRKDFGIH